ncbi:MAG: YfaZ family outer membrane protein [Woeseiaceae bacterium]
MYSRILILATALFMSQVATAEEVTLQLSNDTARFMYLTEAFGQDFGRLELEAGFLYNQNGDSLFNAGLLVRGESISVPLIVSIGARAYIAQLTNYDVAAIAIGGDLLLSPESWGGFGLGAYYYTAPGVVAFQDAENLTEYGIYANFQITPQARIVGGFKNITTSIVNGPDVEIDNGAYFGINLSF